MKAIVSWSGGKDACLATRLAEESGFTIHALLNMAEPEDGHSRAHGLPRQILRSHAKTLFTEFKVGEASWENYRQVLGQALHDAKSEGCTHVVFGDIDLQAHRDWEQALCAEVGITPIWPLWGIDRQTLVALMINEMEIEVVSVQEQFGPKWLGRRLDKTLVQEMVEAGVDPSGENGECHTLVRNAPWFLFPIDDQPKGHELQAGHWMLTW